MIIKVIGRAGTGKTTYLLNWIKQHPKKHIYYVSYAKMVDVDVRSRLVKMGYELFETERGMNTPEGGSITVSTLHSYAYRILGLEKNQRLEEKDYVEFCSVNGLEYDPSEKKLDPDEPFEISNKDEGHRFFSSYEQIRNKMLPENRHEEVYEINRVQSDGIFLEKQFEKYKNSVDKVDYTDMIHDACLMPDGLEHDVVIVDEFQDLSPLQWKLIQSNFLMRGADMIMGGDPYQSIYGFQGADSSIFESVKEDELVILPKSYRMKRNIWDLADGVLPLEDLEVGSGGIVQLHSNDGIGELCQKLGGKTFILTRTNKIGGIIARDLNELGIPFISPKKSRIYSPWNTIKGFDLRTLGLSVIQFSNENDLTDGRMLLTHLKTTGILRRGEKDQLLALSGPIPYSRIRSSLNVDFENSIERLISSLKVKPSTQQILLSSIRTSNIYSDPKLVEISTIHGAKGREADNVILIDSVPKGLREYLIEEDEKRVLYTAITRAKNTFTMVPPIPGTVSYYADFLPGGSS
jgi:superfamily I DNA/RNA helicase